MTRIVNNLIAIVSETWTIAWDVQADDCEAVPAPLVVQMPKYPAAQKKTETFTIDHQTLWHR